MSRFDSEYFDEHGYPTDAAIEKMLTFEGTPRQLIEFIEGDLWWGSAKDVRPLDLKPVDDKNLRPYYKWYMATSGWSGNETIVGKLECTRFWLSFWEMTQRGGGFTFHIPLLKMDKQGFWGDWKRFPGQQSTLTEDEARLLDDAGFVEG